jgi:hypothetical protein
LAIITACALDLRLREIDAERWRRRSYRPARRGCCPDVLVTLHLTARCAPKARSWPCPESIATMLCVPTIRSAASFSCQSDRAKKEGRIGAPLAIVLDGTLD